MKKLRPEFEGREVFCSRLYDSSLGPLTSKPAPCPEQSALGDHRSGPLSEVTVCIVSLFIPSQGICKRTYTGS
jgi:hypothetical protein